jgi:ketosteroid isomerase-like protein
MSDLSSLLRRVEKLEARTEISELVSAYAIACDEHDMPRLSGLFANDATFDSPSKMLFANGRKEISAMFVEMFKIRGAGYHWTHDHFVHFDDSDPDRATGLVLSHAETCPHGVVSLAAMRYQDNYTRIDGRWLFQKRVINFLYYVPATDYPQALTSSTRITMGGRKLPGDFPESLPAWKAFDLEHKRTA